jgi:hypothetical protein
VIFDDGPVNDLKCRSFPHSNDMKCRSFPHCGSDRSHVVGKRVERSATGSAWSDLQAHVGLLGTGVSFSFDRAFETLQCEMDLLKRACNFFQNEESSRRPRLATQRLPPDRTKGFFHFRQHGFYSLEKRPSRASEQNGGIVQADAWFRHFAIPPIHGTDISRNPICDSQKIRRRSVGQ